MDGSLPLPIAPSKQRPDSPEPASHWPTDPAVNAAETSKDHPQAYQLNTPIYPVEGRIPDNAENDPTPQGSIPPPTIEIHPAPSEQLRSQPPQPTESNPLNGQAQTIDAGAINVSLHPPQRPRHFGTRILQGITRRNTGERAAVGARPTIEASDEPEEETEITEPQATGGYSGQTKVILNFIRVALEGS
jgi:hypothetical protein